MPLLHVWTMCLGKALRFENLLDGLELVAPTGSDAAPPEGCVGFLASQRVALLRATSTGCIAVHLSRAFLHRLWGVFLREVCREWGPICFGSGKPWA